MDSMIKLSPAFKDYLWGGTKLREVYDKKCDFDRVAESWELSTHPAGVSVVTTGEYKGLPFNEYLEKIGQIGLGKNCEKFEDFPILIKFIDAKASLSIQVHPSDDYARRVENEYGKTEMWYILDCEEGASLYYGVKEEITKEEFKKRIENNTILEVLNEVKVHKGDTFFIEAGTIHAIGDGIVICEIQQNSNMTYRVYDFERRDDKGNLRPLHIEKALEVSTLKPTEMKQVEDDNVCTKEYKKELLGTCKYFTTQKYEVKTETTIKMDLNSFVSIIVTEGCGTVKKGEQTISFKKGDSLFVPAEEAMLYVEGHCELIVTTV